MVSKQGTEFFFRNIKTESRNRGENCRITEKIKVQDFSLTFSPLSLSLSLSIYLYPSHSLYLSLSLDLSISLLLFLFLYLSLSLDLSLDLGLDLNLDINLSIYQSLLISLQISLLLYIYIYILYRISFGLKVHSHKMLRKIISKGCSGGVIYRVNTVTTIADITTMCHSFPCIPMMLLY